MSKSLLDLYTDYLISPFDKTVDRTDSESLGDPEIQHDIHAVAVLHTILRKRY
jgi:hypothetical protein